MYKKEKRYHRIYFFVILFILFFMGYLLAEKSYLWSTYIGFTMSGLIFLVVFIPLARYLANHLRNFIEERDLHNKNVFKLYLAFFLLIPLALVSIAVYNEYKEKSLIQVAHFDPEDVETMMLYIGPDIHHWKNDIEAAEELYDFFSLY